MKIPLTPFCKYKLVDNYYECIFCHKIIDKERLYHLPTQTCPKAFQMLGLGNYVSFAKARPGPNNYHDIDYQDKHKIMPSGINAQTIMHNTSRLNDNGGPGTELKILLKYIGITASPNCKCNARAKQMDAWGCDICESKMDEIVGWLKEEATNRKLPFIETAARLLVKRAIKNARKKLKPSP